MREMVGFGGEGTHYCVLQGAISDHHFAAQGGMVDAQVLVVVFFAHAGLAVRADGPAEDALGVRFCCCEDCHCRIG